MRASEWKRARTGAAVVTVVALMLTGCTEENGDEKSGAVYDEVVLAYPPWAGARANAIVAEYLLERELDVKVTLKKMPTEEAWDAMGAGEVHAFLEDWRGNLDKEEKYIEEERTVVEGGDLGVTGSIGWFVPKYFADENPDIADWENLNKYAEVFQVPGSGDKGQLLGAEKSWTSYDEHLIENLELNYVIKPAKTEASLVAELEKLYSAKEPFLTYWYEPHWKNLDLDLVEVEFPDYVEGCNEPVEVTDCAYFNTPLQKFFNADFEQNGGDAAEFLRNFRWSTEQQNQVAKTLAVDGLSDKEAAARWVENDDNKSTWQRWLPERRKK